MDKLLKYVYDLFLSYSYDWFSFMDVAFSFYTFFFKQNVKNCLTSFLSLTGPIVSTKLTTKLYDLPWKEW